MRKNIKIEENQKNQQNQNFQMFFTVFHNKKVANDEFTVKSSKIQSCDDFETFLNNFLATKCL